MGKYNAVNLPKQTAKLQILLQLLWLVPEKDRNDLWEKDLDTIRNYLKAGKQIYRYDIVCLNTMYSWWLRAAKTA
jgi:hypothetical protein